MLIFDRMALTLLSFVRGDKRETKVGFSAAKHKQGFGFYGETNKEFVEVQLELRAMQLFIFFL